MHTQARYTRTDAHTNMRVCTLMHKRGRHKQSNLNSLIIRLHTMPAEWKWDKPPIIPNYSVTVAGLLFTISTGY